MYKWVPVNILPRQLKPNYILAGNLWYLASCSKYRSVTFSQFLLLQAHIDKKHVCRHYNLKVVECERKLCCLFSHSLLCQYWQLLRLLRVQRKPPLQHTYLICLSRFMEHPCINSGSWNGNSQLTMIFHYNSGPRWKLVYYSLRLGTVLASRLSNRISKVNI